MNESWIWLEIVILKTKARKAGDTKRKAVRYDAETLTLAIYPCWRVVVAGHEIQKPQGENVWLWGKGDEASERASVSHSKWLILRISPMTTVTYLGVSSFISCRAALTEREQLDLRCKKSWQL